MYYLGIDLGSSSVKVALIDIKSGKSLGVIQEPKEEMTISALQKGWAEQAPEDWWKHVCNAIKKIKKQQLVSEVDIKGIGIAYQMHGLVLLDKKGESLRKSIIWCDSRAVEIGENAFKKMGADLCDGHLLNSPGNFTASKLRWVKENENELFNKVHKFMLPGDYIAYRFSNIINTTISGLSEGIFWDFKSNEISKDVLKEYEIPLNMVPDIVGTFDLQSRISKKGASESGLLEGTPILYRAGDQPNNALSLNVFNPGEIAATGGTSGVVYAITDKLSVMESSRVNNFAHVNYQQKGAKNIGKLLCINGAGIQYRWLLNNLDVGSYQEMNDLANTVSIGADGVCVIPFGNGSERMLLNKEVGARMLNIDLNRHNKAHICRATLEGIAFSFFYGIEIMKSDGITTGKIKAGNDNLFRSKVFSDTIAALTGQEIEIYNTTGAIGAARACAITENGQAAFSNYMKGDYIMSHMPSKKTEAYKKAYDNWKKELKLILNE